MANVRGVGYEVVEAREHAVLAKGRLQRSKVQVRKGIRIVKGTNLSRLTPEELKLLDGISDRLEAHLDVDRRRARADQRYVVNTATRKMRVEMDQRLEEQRLEFERRMAEQLQRLGFMPSEESQTG